MKAKFSATMTMDLDPLESLTISRASWMLCAVKGSQYMTPYGGVPASNPILTNGLFKDNMFACCDCGLYKLVFRMMNKTNISNNDVLSNSARQNITNLQVVLDWQKNIDGFNIRILKDILWISVYCTIRNANLST
jgi:hypothetical protein